MASQKFHTNFILASMVLVTCIASFIAIESKQGKLPNPNLPNKKQLASSPFESEIVNGIHTPTGLIADKNFELVVGNCVSCHSAKLITNNRMNASGWLNTIEWMQETQKLWDLGEDKERIVAYLAKNYAPNQVGRRKNLEMSKGDWYVLED